MTTEYSVKGSECQIWGELKSVKLIKVDGSSKLLLFSWGLKGEFGHQDLTSGLWPKLRVLGPLH